MVRLVFRIIAGFLSAFALVLLSFTFWRLPIDAGFWTVFLSGWLISWIVLELIWHEENSTTRLLTHLRYGPFAIFIFFLVTVFAYDEIMVLHSKWTIRQYVYSGITTDSPSLELHIGHRGFCGKGSSAIIYDLYADTAAESFQSSDPKVRARALRASIEVYDWLNEVYDGPFSELIEQARSDPDPLVRSIAADFQANGVDKFTLSE